MFQAIPSYYRYVSSITIVNAGSGYTSVPTITLSGGGGTGATATCTIFNGEIQTVTVTNIGANYDSAPTVTVSGGGGSGASLTAVLSFASGTTSQYKEKGALTATNALPSFVAEEYAKFVSFLDKYYEYMDLDDSPTNKLLNSNYNDIDYASRDTLDKWALQLAKDFPSILEIDPATLYKSIKSIYEAKGSERSIKAFFRVVYAEEVEVYYPSKDILKASDGRWVVENSVRVIAGYNDYEVLNLEGTLCDIKYYETKGSATIEETIPATVTRVEKIAYTAPQRYELVLEFDTVVSEIPGPGSQAAATVTVVAGEITEITVTNGGYGYTAAPTIIITDSATGTGAEATATVEDGAVTAITVTDGGSDYTAASTTVELSTTSVRTLVVDRGAVSSAANVRAYLERTLATVTSGTYSGADAGFKVGDVFAINETGDDGRAYALSYFAEDYTYVGGGNKAYIKVSAINSSNVPTSWSILNSGSGFLNARSTITVTSDTGEDLDINLTTDYLFSYDGKYKDDRGKLSDVNRLQDNFKYQNYSYIVKSSLPSSVWIKKFKEVTHTAGMEVFGDIVLSSKIEYAPNISYEIDGGMEISIFKLTDTTLANEVVALDLTITLAAETATATDVPALHVFKELEDNTIDSGPNDELGVDDAGGVTYFAEDYCSPSYCREGGFEISLGKNISDTATSTELLVPAMIFNRSFAHTASATESILTSIGYNVSESDTTSNTDSLVHSVGKGVSDTATSSEVFVFSAQTALSDTATATEVFDRQVSYNNTFTDSGTASESDSISVGKNLSNQVTVAEVFTHEIFIPLDVSDSVSATNGDIVFELAPALFCNNPAVVSEIPVININKALVENQTATESVVINLNTPFSDSGTISDSGVITVQDYADPTYFSEDYVGAGYNF